MSNEGIDTAAQQQSNPEWQPLVIETGYARKMGQMVMTDEIEAAFAADTEPDHITD